MTGILHSACGGILGADPKVVLCIFLVVLVLSVPDFSVRANSRHAFRGPGVTIMTVREHEAAADDPLPVLIIKNVFRVSTALFCRSPPNAVAIDALVATAGVRN